MKKVICICLLVIMSLTFYGCDTKEDTAKTLLIGTIENTMHGKVNSEYADINAWSNTKIAAESERNEIRREMILYLMATYGYDDYTNSNNAKVMYFEHAYAEILKQFEYTMSELEEVEKGKYKATITYKPFALGDALDDTAMSFYAQKEEESLSGINRATWKFDDELFKLLSEKAEEFAEDVKYNEELSLEVAITIKDKEWILSDNYYTEFLANIMDLNIDELDSEVLGETEEMEQVE